MFALISMTEKYNSIIAFEPEKKQKKEIHLQMLSFWKSFFLFSTLIFEFVELEQSSTHFPMNRINVFEHQTLCFDEQIRSYEAFHVTLDPTFATDPSFLPMLTSMNDSLVIRFARRGSNFIHVFLSSYFYQNRCFQTNFAGRIQLVFGIENHQETEHDCSINSRPCQNGGSCKMLKNGTSTCVCPENAFGSYCEKRK